MMRITESEILEALRLSLEPAESGDPGLTAAQIRKQFGLGERRVRELLAREIEAGRVVVGRAWRKAIDGTLRHVPVYRKAP